jgi:cell division protein FtsZ
MSVSGKTMIGSALASDPDRARVAAEHALALSLMDGFGLSGAKGVLVLITASRNHLTLSDSRLALSTVRAHASPNAHVIYGVTYDVSLNEQLRVIVVAIGLDCGA